MTHQDLSAVPADVISKIRALLKHHESELLDLLNGSFQAFAFENRYMLHPRRLRELGREDIEEFRSFLRSLDADIGLSHGKRRAFEGLSQKPLLRVGNILREFYISHIGPDSPQLLQTALRCVESYMAAYLDGFIQAREEQVLKDQEQLRVALITALDRQRRELHIKNHAIHTSINGIILCGLDGLITYANPAILKMWGYAKEEQLIDTPCAEFWPGDKRSIMELLRERGGWQGDTTAKRLDGSSFEVAISASLIRDESNLPVGIISFFFDVTQRKHLEAQFRQSQKMEALGQLAGGIVHDFNNLLTAISGYTQLALMELPEGSKHYQDFLQIKTATDRGKELTQELRIFTRQTSSSREPVNLNGVVEETYKILVRTFPAEIRILLELDPELKVIRGNPSQMSQMMMNLCVNARDAIISALREHAQGKAPQKSQGLLTLKTYNLNLDTAVASRFLNAKPGSYVCLSVQDNGIGIPSDNLDRLFEPFFTTKSEKASMGLGLAVVYGIVQNHGGFIDVHSKEIEGSIFNIFLPSHKENRVKTPQAGSTIDLASGRGTILIAEDNPQVQEMITKALTKSGYAVLTAKNGTEAIELYTKNTKNIDLVILDMVMPQMSGRECFFRLKSLNPEAKILIMTGFTADGSAEDFIKEGACGVITKPFELHDFTQTIQKIIHEKSALR